jgi:hypothetical protein
MFNRISVINKIETVENKIDILLARIESETLFGCCDCKKRESDFCKELKTYIEDKMTQMEKDMKEKLANIDASLVCFTDILHSYKTDLVGNLEIISEHIANTPQEGALSKIHEIIETIKQEQKQHQNKLLESMNVLGRQLEVQIKISSEENVNTQRKLDVLFYENEIIKHQLLLEDEIRRYNDEIINIKDKVHKTIKDIDECLLTKC